MVAFRFSTLLEKLISKLKADLDGTISPDTRRAQLANNFCLNCVCHRRCGSIHTARLCATFCRRARQYRVNWPLKGPEFVAEEGIPLPEEKS